MPVRRGRWGALRLCLLLLTCLAPGRPAAAAEICKYQAGEGGLLIRATILTPSGVLPHGEVLVGEDGVITCVGRCAAPAVARASVLDCADAVLSPGFINPHDHIDYAGIAPIPDSGERYDHRHEWRRGLNGHTRLETFGPSSDPRVIAWGELRFLAGGTTSIVGEAMAPGLTRNLDFAAGLEGLAIRPVTYQIFPLDDAKGILRVGDCNYGPHPTTRADVAASAAFLAHVSEGKDAAAQNEFRCESSTTFDTTPQPGGGGVSNDWILPQATLIHAVALTPEDLKLVAERRASIVWSPRSNLALYGTTLDVESALRAGINVALGSDWLPSGSMDMNRELACARHYSQAYLGGRISDAQLWRMATINAARATHADAHIGDVAVGKQADLVLFAPSQSDPYASVVQSTPQTTILVLRGGKPLYGDAALMGLLRPDCVSIPVAGADKQLCPESGAIAPAVLVAFAADERLYPLAFEGIPHNEPPCEKPTSSRR